MGSVVQLRLRDRPSREQAKQWLSVNCEAFPSVIDGDIGPNLFYGWRFICAIDGQIYFANCLERGISQQEFQSFLAQAMQR